MFVCDSCDVDNLQETLSRCIPEKSEIIEEMIQQMTEHGESNEEKFKALLQTALDYVKFGN